MDYAAITVPVEVSYPDDIPANGEGGSSWKDHKIRNESDRYNWEQCKSSVFWFDRLADHFQ